MDDSTVHSTREFSASEVIAAGGSLVIADREYAADDGVSRVCVQVGMSMPRGTAAPAVSVEAETHDGDIATSGRNVAESFRYASDWMSGEQLCYIHEVSTAADKALRAIRVQIHPPTVDAYTVPGGSAIRIGTSR